MNFKSEELETAIAFQKQMGERLAEHIERKHGNPTIADIRNDNIIRHTSKREAVVLLLRTSDFGNGCIMTTNDYWPS